MTLFYYILISFFPAFFHNQGVDRWIIEISPGKEICIDDWWKANGFENTYLLKRKLRVENWMVLEVPRQYVASLKQLPCVQTIMMDGNLKFNNTIPEDPEYKNQDGMDLIGMPSAWDFTQGGVTSRGDTIIVAIIDDGFQLDHEDLAENICHHKDEIPNDGIDNDNNGYIDDFTGLNITTGTDNHPVRSHGTSVSGIIGAMGNNGKGISGVNWNVKLMLISYNNRISELVDAYQYVIDMRKKYNDTSGDEGAFIVAVNLSSGLEFALPKNFPLWCSMYDKLGEEGVLSVCSGPNNNHSVDVKGGLPARCTSPYTINVTNVNQSDVKMDNAGYGRISMDIGAPGEHSLTTDTSNSYNYFRGTRLQHLM